MVTIQFNKETGYVVADALTFYNKKREVFDHTDFMEDADRLKPILAKSILSGDVIDLEDHLYKVLKAVVKFKIKYLIIDDLTKEHNGYINTGITILCDKLLIE